MERRTFLKGLFGVAGVAAAAEGRKSLETLFRPRTSSSRAQEDSGTGAVEFSEMHELFSWKSPQSPTPEHLEKLMQLSVTLRRLQTGMREQFNQEGIFEWKDGSVALQEELRRVANASTLKQDLEAAAEAILQTKALSSYQTALYICTSCSCQGMLYSAIERAAARLRVPSPVEHREQFYCARVRDYLPEGHSIWSQDIDPRNTPKLIEEDATVLANEPGWSGQARKRAFRELSANSGIQRLAKEQDLTLAEYFSLLKAIQHEHLREVWQEVEVIPPTTPEQFATRLLRERAQLLQRNLLDRTTDGLLVLYGRDREGVHAGSDEHHWQDIGRAAGVRPEAIRAFGTTQTHNAEEVREQFFAAIRRSRGTTFIAVDSHGSRTSVGVDNERPQASVTAQKLAELLIERVLETRDAHSLEKVTVCVEACYTYHFAQNLQAGLTSIWSHMTNPPFPLTQLRQPTIITAVQESARATHSAKAMSILSEQLPAIQKDGALKGRRLLQVIQPLAYTENDMTFFAPGSGIEFATRTQANQAIG